MFWIWCCDYKINVSFFTYSRIMILANIIKKMFLRHIYLPERLRSRRGVFRDSPLTAKTWHRVAIRFVILPFYHNLYAKTTEILDKFSFCYYGISIRAIFALQKQYFHRELQQELAMAVKRTSLKPKYPYPSRSKGYPAPPTSAYRYPYPSVRRRNARYPYPYGQPQGTIKAAETNPRIPAGDNFAPGIGWY